MKQYLRVLLVVLLSLVAPGVSAAPPVVRGKTPPPTADYEAAAVAAGVNWGSDTDRALAGRILLDLQSNRPGLTLVLPARVPITKAESWLQSLADSFRWTDARLYSYQGATQSYLVVREQSLTSPVSPYRRRASLNLALFQSSIQGLNPGRVFLCVRSIDAAIISVEPPAANRAIRRGDSYLFYPALPNVPAPLAVTYGLTSRQALAVSLAVLLWLLFPVVVLWVYRSRLMGQPEVTHEARQRIYGSWQRGVRIAGVAGALFTFVVLRYTRVVPGFVSPGVSVLIPLWWWYGAIGNLIMLPEPLDVTGRTDTLGRWLSAAGDFALAAFMTFFLLAPYCASHQNLTRLVDLIPLVVGGGGAVVLLAFTVWLHFIRRRVGVRVTPRPPTSELPDDPDAVRELLRQLSREIAVEEPATPPTFPKGVPSSAVQFALAMHAVIQKLDLDQRAALKASDQIATSEEPVRPPSLYSLVWSFSPLVVAGFVAWFVPGPIRVAVLLTGAGTVSVFLIDGSRRVNASLKALHQRVEDADVRVAEAMEDPRPLLDALRRLEDCDRLHRPKSGGATDEPSIYGERRRRLARRLGLD